jgi:G3E family GTPase
VTNPRVPTFVIAGYLGSGKTTFINALLSGGATNVAVVVNDFGDVNIDASLIRQTHADTIELTNGCICCAIGGSLADTLFTLLDRPTIPSTVIIEASGVADPASVAAYTHISGLSPAGTVVLIDASEFSDNHRNELIRSTLERQVRAAHLLAFTKTDIATDVQRNEVELIVSALAPQTPAVATTAEILAFLVDAQPSPRIDPAHPERTTVSLREPTISLARQAGTNSWNSSLRFHVQLCVPRALWNFLMANVFWCNKQATTERSPQSMPPQQALC